MKQNNVGNRGVPQVGVARMFAPWSARPAIVDHLGNGYLFTGQGEQTPTKTSVVEAVTQEQSTLAAFWGWEPN